MRRCRPVRARYDGGVVGMCCDVFVLVKGAGGGVKCWVERWVKYWRAVFCIFPRRKQHGFVLLLKRSALELVSLSAFWRHTVL